MTRFFTDCEPERVVTPGSAGEVQDIIKKANRDKTPLVPVSSGTNLQDTHMPAVTGAVAVDLSQLKGLYFDELNRNIVVEPGVTFQDLDAYCKKSGLRTLSAIDVPRTASILSTYLEMMPLYDWPKYHPWEMLTMEGYRADGQHFATGQMAMKQDRPDKYSWGASFAQVARLFCLAQGTLGIITKAAVTLKTDLPKKQVLFFACKNVNQATAALKAFMATEEPQEIFAANKTYLAEFLQSKASAGMGPWTVVIVNRGADDAEIDYKRKDMAAIARKLKGKVSTTITGMPKAAETVLAEIQSPSGASLHGNGSVWAPYVTIATAAQVKECAGMFPARTGSILLPLQAGGCFYYQPDLRCKPADVSQARKVYVDTCKKMLKTGILFPRPSVLIAKEVAACNPQSFSLLRELKKAVDPKNIMNPGKLGL